MNKNLILFSIMLLSYTLSFGQHLSSPATKADLVLNDKIIFLYGRKIELNPDGFPKQFLSFFNGDKSLNNEGVKILYEPLHFHFYTTAKTQDKLIPTGFDLNSSSSKFIKWTATSRSEHLEMQVIGNVDRNGLMKFHIKLKALNDMSLYNINFHIPIEKTIPDYLVGLGHEGLRPDTAKWSLGEKFVDPAVWVGNRKAGLYFNPLSSGNSNIPDLKMQINIKGSSMLTEVYTGNVNLAKGGELHFDFSIILTPLDFSDSEANLKNRFKSYRKLDRK